MKRLNVLILGLALSLSGCANYLVHQGAVDTIDSQTYDALLVAKSTIDSTRDQLASGALPPSIKPALNDAIKAYDVAQIAWHAYHDKAITNPAALQVDLDSLAKALVALNGAKQ